MRLQVDAFLLLHFDNLPQILIILAVRQIPAMNGFELVRKLLESETTPLGIVHTSVIDSAVTRDLIAAGVGDIVFKPVDYAAFASKTRALLGRRATQQKFRDTPQRISMQSTLSDGNSESLSNIFSPPDIGGQCRESRPAVAESGDSLSHSGLR